MRKIAGSGSESGSMIQKHGSTDLDSDPHKNIGSGTLKATQPISNRGLQRDVVYLG
jgi:hypothetical protein